MREIFPNMSSSRKKHHRLVDVILMFLDLSINVKNMKDTVAILLVRMVVCLLSTGAGHTDLTKYKGHLMGPYDFIVEPHCSKSKKKNILQNKKKQNKNKLLNLFEIFKLYFEMINC